MVYSPNDAFNWYTFIGSDNSQIPVFSICSILVLSVIFSGLIISTVMVLPGIPVPSIFNRSPWFNVSGIPFISSLTFSFPRILFVFSPNFRLIFSLFDHDL